MNLTFTPSAWDDYQWFVQHDRKLLKRINALVGGYTAHTV
jgi:Txe/YoeB family toxin of Txe-Axe toxin-antitoxin module